MLRAAHTWNDTQQLEYHLGFGSGIHNFKNYVLRADQKYRARAELGLSQALLIVNRNRTATELDAAKKAALDEIEAVVRRYERALPKVDQLVGEGKTAREVDVEVKIDDRDALRALDVLRK